MEEGSKRKTLSMANIEEDADLELAIKLSKEEAEKEIRERREMASLLSPTSNLSMKEKESTSLHSITFDPNSFGEFLLAGFDELWETKLYADFVLIVGKERIPVHKIVLCSWSETFRVMLENETWKESRQSELEINIDEKDVPLFKKILLYMYKGSVNVVYDEVIPLLALSNYYGVLPLKDGCSNILADSIDDDSVFYLIEVAQQYHCSQLNSECANYLAEQFSNMLANDKLNKLDVDTWVEMLKSDDIQVTSEEEVFRAVIRFAEQFSGELKTTILEKTLPHVRFTMLSNSFLFDEVESNAALTAIPLVHQILFETFRYKAYPAAAQSAPLMTKVKPRKGTMMFDAENCNPHIILSNDKLKAINNNRHNTWTTVRCFPAFGEGIGYREFKAKFSNYMMIGVETKDNNGSSRHNQYPGQTPHGWTWYSAGQIYHANNCTQAQSPYSSGDTVGILVDTYEGKLVFYRNGKPTKAAFHNLPKPTSGGSGYQELFPVISMYGDGDMATIVPGQNIPDKLPKGWSLNKKAPSQQGGAPTTVKRRKGKT